MNFRTFPHPEKEPYAQWLAGPLTAQAIRDDYEIRALLERYEVKASFFYPAVSALIYPEEVRALVRDMPADRIIVETDCPYLAPVPHRGRRNEPAYIGLVLEKLADIRGWSAEEADRRTTEALFALFDRIPRPEA